MSAIIYLLTNTVNGKQYVGQTSRGLEERWRDHCSKARGVSNYMLHNAIRKYGPDVFTREILEHTTVDKINDRETYWIAEIKTHQSGYNMTEGGEGTRGIIRSESYRAKMSAAKKGKYTGENNHNYGKTFSLETRMKLSLANKGKTISPEQRRRVSEKLKGKIFSNETRAKISEALQGEKHPQYGNSRSDETRAKISEALLGPKSPNYGKKFSPEARAKMSAAKKRRDRMKRITAPEVTIHVG